MKRTSPYHPLRWVVEVHGHCGFPGWETIAGSNAETVAKDYERRCQLAAPRGVTYRTLTRRNRGIWDTV